MFTYLFMCFIGVVVRLSIFYVFLLIDEFIESLTYYSMQHLLVHQWFYREHYETPWNTSESHEQHGPLFFAELVAQWFVFWPRKPSHASHPPSNGLCATSCQPERSCSCGRTARGRSATLCRTWARGVCPRKTGFIENFKSRVQGGSRYVEGCWGLPYLKIKVWK